MKGLQFWSTKNCTLSDNAFVECLWMEALRCQTTLNLLFVFIYIFLLLLVGVLPLVEINVFSA